MNFLERQMFAAVISTFMHPDEVYEQAIREVRLRKKLNSLSDMPHIVASVSRGAYPQNLPRCIQVFAAPDGRMKGRSKRGWHGSVDFEPWEDNLLQAVARHGQASHHNLARTMGKPAKAVKSRLAFHRAALDAQKRAAKEARA